MHNFRHHHDLTKCENVLRNGLHGWAIFATNDPLDFVLLAASADTLNTLVDVEEQREDHNRSFVGVISADGRGVSQATVTPLTQEQIQVVAYSFAISLGHVLAAEMMPTGQA